MKRQRNRFQKGSGCYKCQRCGKYRESRENGMQALGRDYDGNEDPDIKPNPYAVLLDKYEHGNEAWSVRGEGMQDQWDTSRGAGVWVPDHACVEHIESSAIAKLLPDGVKVEYKSKLEPDGTVKQANLNIITITYPDGATKGGYKSFTAAYRAAARKLGVKLDKEAIAKARRLVAIECARQACETYTDWLNGNCYGVCVEVFNKDSEQEEDDACWGYIGNYAEKEMRDLVDHYAKKEQQA